MNGNELSGALKEAFEKLDDEAKKKLEAAKTPQEALAILQADSRELTDDELDVVAGGDGWALSCDEAACRASDLNPNGNS